MLEDLIFKVEAAGRDVRLDRFLRSRLPEVPARSVRFAIEAGDVRVNGKVRRKGDLLSGGEEITVRRIAEAGDWKPEGGDLPGARVLYQDGGAAVLDKPHDVHTEPHRPREKGTLAGYLRFRFPHVADLSPLPGLTLLTRLDYATSGVVPAALSREAFEFLSREREKGGIRKTYLCLVRGRLEEEMTLSFRIDAEGGETVRVRTDLREEDPLRWTVVTPVRVGNSASLVQARISRGKRHQIRAHLAAAGFPVAGDRKYSAVPPEGAGKIRLMLHAAEVSFLHPERGTPTTVASPVPEEFLIT